MGLVTTVTTIEQTEEGKDWLGLMPARTRLLGKEGIEGVWDAKEYDVILDGSHDHLTKKPWLLKLHGSKRLAAEDLFRTTWRSWAEKPEMGKIWGKVREIGGLYIGVGIFSVDRLETSLRGGVING
jgi:hypothetical protein